MGIQADIAGATTRLTATAIQLTERAILTHPIERAITHIRLIGRAIILIRLTGRITIHALTMAAAISIAALALRFHLVAETITVRAIQIITEIVITDGVTTITTAVIGS